MKEETIKYALQELDTISGKIVIDKLSITNNILTIVFYSELKVSSFEVSILNDQGEKLNYSCKILSDNRVEVMVELIENFHNDLSIEYSVYDHKKERVMGFFEVSCLSLNGIEESQLDVENKNGMVKLQLERTALNEKRFSVVFIEMYSFDAQYPKGFKQTYSPFLIMTFGKAYRVLRLKYLMPFTDLVENKKEEPCLMKFSVKHKRYKLIKGIKYNDFKNIITSNRFSNGYYGIFYKSNS